MEVALSSWTDGRESRSNDNEKVSGWSYSSKEKQHRYMQKQKIKSSTRENVPSPDPSNATMPPFPPFLLPNAIFVLLVVGISDSDATRT
jgi:hypothetical protein